MHKQRPLKRQRTQQNLGTVRSGDQGNGQEIPPAAQTLPVPRLTPQENLTYPEAIAEEEITTTKTTSRALSRQGRRNAKRQRTAAAESYGNTHQPRDLCILEGGYDKHGENFDLIPVHMRAVLGRTSAEGLRPYPPVEDVQDVAAAGKDGDKE